MPPISLNRRRFLGCSAAAGLALSQGRVGEGAIEQTPIRLGVIGLGTRGTSLVRALLELPSAQVVALADADPRRRARAQGIVEKACGQRPDAYERAAQVLERPDVEAVAIALPCDLHAGSYRDALRAGKHLYAEKPLALTTAECDMLLAESARLPALVVHVGFQRRSNPRHRDAVALVRRGDLGPLLSGQAAWLSSHGPMSGYGDWLAHRERSGDWMVEQAVHVWDVYHWLAGALPVRAFGQGCRDLFPGAPAGRDVTDHYTVQLAWPDGFSVAFTQSWIAPADDRFTGVSLLAFGAAGALDLGSGAVTFRDKDRPRQVLHPGNQPDTRLALASFLDAVRADEPAPPPLTLAEARAATVTGLLVRKAVDERREVSRDEIDTNSPSRSDQGHPFRRFRDDSRTTLAGLLGAFGGADRDEDVPFGGT